MPRGLTPRTFLVCGLAAGLLAGIAAFAIAWLFGEPHLNAAIALEEAAAHAHHHAEEAAPVSRDVQSTIGLLAGTLVIGTLIGGVTGLVAALGMGRLGTLRPMASTAIVVALGYVGFHLLPFLKYPANPPTVGDPDTINERTALFFGYTALMVVAVVVGVLVVRRLLARVDGYRALLGGVVATLAIVVVAALAFPTVDEVGDFPATLLWSFRTASLLSNAALWAVLGFALAGLIGRVAGKAAADQARRDLAASL